MYEKNSIYIFMVISLLFSSCATTMVSNIGDRTAEHRELQGEIRKGETELAITGSKIESGVGTIENGLGRIIEVGNDLESSIRESAGNQSEIGGILFSVRERLFNADWLFRDGIEQAEKQVQ